MLVLYSAKEIIKDKSKFMSLKQLKYRQEIEMKFRNKEDIVKNEIWRKYNCSKNIKQ